MTITNEMFMKLSAFAQEEIMDVFRGSSRPVTREYVAAPQPMDMLQPNTSPTTSAFDSAALSFSEPLVLPFTIQGKRIRYAENAPAAVSTDTYTVKSPEEIKKITQEIDDRDFIGADSWLKGQKHHPENFDVRRVLHVLSQGPACIYTINTRIRTMARSRLTAILRQLKIQGIVSVRSIV